ncbi:PREDICTED: long-chain-fatty-acid--CoA ligase 1-like [Rhagoletis zephyria]|uniref:long-chain-fatty-acid--CoA ligase 1-like n=1 Tax=Rhagoletis zephyria TaxID=28612 RepID=UPI0008114B4C|nr:PREDICTED: long-chain-fatty-acid--CoA ligase 1-like [Rhagoletis zephyria]
MSDSDTNSQGRMLEYVRSSPLGEDGKFLLTANPEVRTCLDCIYHGFELAKEQDCIGRKSGYSNDYEWFSYNQSLIAEFGCYHYSIVVVPVYDTFKASLVLEILQEIDPGVIVTDSNERAKQLMSIGRTQSLHSIIITSENIHQETLSYASSKGLQLYPFTEVERLGSMNPSPVKLPKPTDLAVINFTSGTTGLPKGVLLTHANLVASMSALLLQILCMFYSGGRVGIYFGDFKDLSRDLPVLQPTIMVCVPRILNRIYHRVITKVKGNWVKSRVLDVALKSKHPETVFNENVKNSIWDKLVFKTVKQSLGGNLKLLISGSNQISNIVLNFMRNSLGCTVLQSYDITECASFVTLTMFDDQSPKHLGQPIACNVVKLVDVPEFNICTKESGIGEICVKGTNVFSGYYKDHDTYQGQMDDEGWFHTNDIGMWLSNGCLKFIDRKEDLSFISNPYGKLIAPNKIENIYIQSIYVGQCYVDVDYDRGYLIGIIVPDIGMIFGYGFELFSVG